MAIQDGARVSEGRVDRAALERSLATLVAETTLPSEHGFFGPRSAAWRVLRERALVTYAPRAVMLQYAHPPFAAASASYAAHASSPGARFERAIATLLRMVFGTRELALRDARRLHLLHDRLHGVLDDGTAFHGNDRASLAWILVTLLDASVRGYERHVGALPDGLFDDVVYFARLFGLDARDVPSSRAALDSAIATQPLAIGAEARAMWAFLAEAERRRERAARHLMRGWTAATLPASLRAALGSRMQQGQARAIERAGSALRARLLPPRIRYVEAYLDAVNRIRA